MSRVRVIEIMRRGPRGAPGDMDPAEWDAWQTALNNTVRKTGNESIAGTKTFSSSPVVPTPTANGHAAPKSYIDGLIDALTGLLNTLTTFVNTHVARTDNPHSVTKSQVGLGNVDNTSDMDKPVSTAQQAALNLKTNLTLHIAHLLDRSNPHRTTKAQVGLGNVDNTSDIDKPVSTAQQAVFTAHTARMDGIDATVAWHADVLVPEAHRIEGDILWMGPGGPQWHQLDDVLNGVNTTERYGYGEYDSGDYKGGA